MADEGVCPLIPVKWTGLAIREYLMAVGEGSAYDFYKCYRRVKPSTSYATIRKYFHYLRKLGLIEKVREEDTGHGFPKVYYRIVPGMEDDERWFRPQAAIYPQTALGKRRYRRLKERAER